MPSNCGKDKEKKFAGKSQKNVIVVKIYIPFANQIT